MSFRHPKTYRKEGRSSDLKKRLLNSIAMADTAHRVSTRIYNDAHEILKYAQRNEGRYVLNRHADRFPDCHEKLDEAIRLLLQVEEDMRGNESSTLTMFTPSMERGTSTDAVDPSDNNESSSDTDSGSESGTDTIPVPASSPQKPDFSVETRGSQEAQPVVVAVVEPPTSQILDQSACPAVSVSASSDQ